MGKVTAPDCSCGSSCVLRLKSDSDQASKLVGVMAQHCGACALPAPPLAQGWGWGVLAALQGSRPAPIILSIPDPLLNSHRLTSLEARFHVGGSMTIGML